MGQMSKGVVGAAAADLDGPGHVISLEVILLSGHETHQSGMLIAQEVAKRVAILARRGEWPLGKHARLAMRRSGATSDGQVAQVLNRIVSTHPRWNWGSPGMGVG